jgi:hypothetical protein
MKKAFLLILILLSASGLWDFFYWRMPERIRIFFSSPPAGKAWQNEVNKFSNLYPDSVFDYIFIGDSHIEQCEWYELFPQKKVRNRGIGGETTGALLARMEVSIKPGARCLVLQIGINDLLSGIENELIIQNYDKILGRLKDQKLYSICCLPFFTRYRPEVKSQQKELNQKLKKLIESKGFICLDMNPLFAPGGQMKSEFTSDGVHLNTLGYQKWLDSIKTKLP